MDPHTALKEMRRTRGAIDHIDPPSVPGVYAWFLRRGGSIGPFVVTPDEPIYIGRSVDLGERSLQNHFKSGQTGWSTLRRSLGAILKTDLGLAARRRGIGPSKSNIRQYRFDDPSEEALTDWMRENLDFGYCACDDPESTERQLLRAINPLLNLKDCDNPHAREIKALRKICAEEAARRGLTSASS